MHTIPSVIDEAMRQIALVTTTSRLDAEILLAYVLQVQRSYLHTYPDRILSDKEYTYFNQLVLKRTQGIPIPYLTGHCEFWSLDLIVTSDTLIPRPETELLVELALKKQSSIEPRVVADLGTGSGAIALALAHERPSWTIYATDASEAALAIAKANAARLGIQNIIFCHGHWCAALPQINFDMIVSNPPYIAENDPYLQPSVLATEPLSALISGSDGFDDIRHIIHEAASYLKKGASLLLEHGFSQAKSVQNEFLKVGYTDVTTESDFSGLNRVTTGVF